MKLPVVRYSPVGAVFETCKKSTLAYMYMYVDVHTNEMALLEFISRLNIKLKYLIYWKYFDKK